MTLEYDPIGITFEDQSSIPSVPSADRIKIYFRGGVPYYLDDGNVEHSFSGTAPATPGTFQARLTLTSGTPITIADVTGGSAVTIYLTPLKKGNRISLYTGGVWTSYDLTEIPLSLSGLTTAAPYDIFVYDSGGSPVLEAVVWTNSTTRATGLTTQNDVYVKSGSTNKRYVGTIQMAATSQCEDSVSKRYVWNYYNRVQRIISVFDSANSWTYTSATWTSLNTSTANRVSFVIGVAEDPVYFAHYFGCTSATGYGGICLDNTNANDAFIKSWDSASLSLGTSVYYATIAIGAHFLQLTQSGNTTTSFFGDNNTPTLFQSGGIGNLWC